MLYVFGSETGMVVQLLIGLIYSDNGIKVRNHWKGLLESEDSEEPLKNVYEDVPVLLEQLPKRTSTPGDLADKKQCALRL